VIYCTEYVRRVDESVSTSATTTRQNTIDYLCQKLATKSLAMPKGKKRKRSLPSRCGTCRRFVGSDGTCKVCSAASAAAEGAEVDHKIPSEAVTNLDEKGRSDGEKDDAKMGKSEEQSGKEGRKMVATSDKPRDQEDESSKPQVNSLDGGDSKETGKGEAVAEAQPTLTGTVGTPKIETSANFVSPAETSLDCSRL